MDIHDVDDHNYTALMHCCVKGYCGVETKVSDDANNDRLACVKLLIEQGSNVNFTSVNERMTPLHWAAYHNDFETVKLLVQYGANQIKNLDKNYPVDIAAFCKHEQIVQFFADKVKEPLK